MSMPAYEHIHHGGELRTKFSHPYSYDPIRHFHKWVGGEAENAYDDRMRQWNYRKWDDAFKAVHTEMGNSFRLSNPKTAEKILRLYYESPTLVLIDLIEWCNVATGYPCFSFGFLREPDFTAKPPAANDAYETQYE